jgi:hypothetical protein
MAGMLRKRGVEAGLVEGGAAREGSVPPRDHHGGLREPVGDRVRELVRAGPSCDHGDERAEHLPLRIDRLDCVEEERGRDRVDRVGVDDCPVFGPEVDGAVDSVFGRSCRGDLARERHLDRLPGFVEAAPGAGDLQRVAVAHGYVAEAAADEPLCEEPPAYASKLLIEHPSHRRLLQ